ncbi:type II CAAX endopeptidase family protein [Dolichospermum planctonicum CS-1226]|uniref:Type II CAAX endopeptidase family protein n=1 Tax=Dolichospermum planctonicum CS-1226 TaxID=3021751 RepID=A0ABT5AK72_9CYAN|nr:type II CAAX endopeptidase family protein [Dolichospermum planctonicum]MDB9537713.1 type II CAAX endopeptidase family protein [Dolichospermum planctonicum CS-1226]
MTIKRLLLIVLTLLVIMLSGLSLLSSWQKPQFQSRLELYQTNIVLQAQGWQPEDSSDHSIQTIQESIIGENPLESATKQYQEASESIKTSLQVTKNKLTKLQSLVTISISAEEKSLQNLIQEQEKLLAEVDLRLGILQAQEQETDKAIKTWSNLQQYSDINPKYPETAETLTGMWSKPPRLFPKAEKLIQQNLNGWFRDTALVQLYRLQQRQEALSVLEIAQQEAATQALFKLGIIATIPSLTALIGTIMLILLLTQRLLKGRESLLARNGDLLWSTPWNWEIIIQVFVLGFFLMGQLFIPELLSILPIPRGTGNVRVEALKVLVSYVLVALGCLSVLYFSIKRFFPLPPNWFGFNFFSNWFFWGIGGYCTALPIVVIVSLINQKLWQGQGGSNPLLQMALESRDHTALGIFFFTAAIAAPIFEEFLFRGFLLPSLTRYTSVWGAILTSALLFAAAHLSLSEILPLTALGIVLGVVYTRTRNLLASMFLHSLWNSGTLISLFILGSNN